MTRPELDRLFEQHYAELVQVASRGKWANGPDVVQQCYVVLIEEQRYTEVTRSGQGGRKWLIYQLHKMIRRVKQHERRHPVMPYYSDDIEEEN